MNTKCVLAEPKRIELFQLTGIFYATLAFFGIAIAVLIIEKIAYLFSAIATFKRIMPHPVKSGELHGKYEGYEKEADILNENILQMCQWLKSHGEACISQELKLTCEQTEFYLRSKITYRLIHSTRQR